MATESTCRQLDIWWVSLDPSGGANPAMVRPCVVLQQDILNQYSPTTMVVPILLGHKSYPYVVNLNPTPDNGLDKPRHINLKYLRTVSVKRLLNPQGRLEDSYLEAAYQALQIVLGL